MAEEPTDLPTTPPVEDKFGPPHAQAVSESLQLWILLPGLMILLFLIGQYSISLHIQGMVCTILVLLAYPGYGLYKLLRKQGERERKRAEKRLKKQERLERKKAK